VFSRTSRLTASSRKSSTTAVDRWCRAGGIIFGLALLGTSGAVPAFARTAYDGDWSVLIETHRGACEPAIRYGVAIDDGRIINHENAPATVQGRVTSTGAVRVSVQSGSEWVSGSGHLNRAQGSGLWRGQGTSGTCIGTWSAQRRSYSAASETGAPRFYNYVRGATTVAGHENSGRGVSYCQAHFRSYNPATGNYMGYDGVPHPCP
jgi:BA14K-like protein